SQDCQNAQRGHHARRWARLAARPPNEYGTENGASEPTKPQTAPQPPPSISMRDAVQLAWKVHLDHEATWGCKVRCARRPASTVSKINMPSTATMIQRQSCWRF